MRLLKYSNPHLAVDATRIVSRKTLQLQNNAGDGVERGGEADDVELDRAAETEGLHVKLEEIVAKRLNLKRVLTPSGEPRSNKRRRVVVEEGEGKAVEPQLATESVGEFEFSYSPQASPQTLPKLFVWYQNHCRPMSSV